mgnify:CR=1 FL=1
MKGILLVNLGSPKNLEDKSIKEYLREFLSDDLVIDYPKWIQQVCQMDPLAAQGRPRGDFVTHGVDFEGSQKWVDFWSAPGAQKSRWMLALGRPRGAKNATRDGQTLGGDILFEKMAPRARLARAFIIN